MMSTPEFFGVFLGLAMAIATIVFMMISYESALQRQFQQMLIYLRMAGFLSLGCWLTMTAVIVKYNKDYSVLKAAKMFYAEPETRIVGQGIVSPKMYSFELDSGRLIQWEHGNGLRSGRCGSEYSGWLGISERSGDGERDCSVQLPCSGTSDGCHGGSCLSRAESEEQFRI